MRKTHFRSRPPGSGGASGASFRRPIFHRLRVSKLPKTSHPQWTHVISVYGYIEYHRSRQRIYTEVSYPTMSRQVFEWLVWRVLEQVTRVSLAQGFCLDGVLVTHHTSTLQTGTSVSFFPSLFVFFSCSFLFLWLSPVSS